ncbi:hypothetical protein EV138_1426 [Kribbella voronezhensis]|uniref:Uncharacterized protein n=1 Tax=Kribbella voronezhensis TaxID=2512212 RepID=A0A4R7T7I4_9ACTN|nr:hypothetical protein [Kribbella voronezhensis]TDU87890.1 hypothetical protein EV138_1426 [Kribbella voronezhensis]
MNRAKKLTPETRSMARQALQVHLKTLEKAGLVTAQLELSDDGKALKYYEAAPFSLHLTPPTWWRPLSRP